jgi:hypothetical protein
LLVGHAQAVHKARLQSGFTHPIRDRFSAAVDEHRIYPDRLKKDDIAQEPLDDILIVHRAAAILNDEQFASEALNEWKRLDERLGACGR